MSDADLQKRRARLVRLLHLRALSWDPDIKKYRTNEANTADAIEVCLNDPLERVTGGGDWRGKRSGKIYDDCSPARAQFFDTTGWQRSLEDHLYNKAGVDIVTVDLRARDLTQDHLRRIADIVAALPRAAKRRVVLLLDGD